MNLYRYQLMTGIFFSVLCAFMLAACGKHPATATKPIVDTEPLSYKTGYFVRFYLLTQDVEAAKQFYGVLLGWQFREDASNPGNYFILNQGKTIGTVLPHLQQTAVTEQAIWLASMSVSDVDKTEKRVQRTGGEVLQSSFNRKGLGRMAIVSDTQGAAFIVQHSAQGDNAADEVLPGDCLWMELWTDNVKKSAYFYQVVAGYEVNSKRLDNTAAYYRFSYQNIAIAGMLTSPMESVKPNWVPYFMVLDIKLALEKARANGGRIIIEPDVDLKAGLTALIADPTGGVFAIQELKQRFIDYENY